MPACIILKYMHNYVLSIGVKIFITRIYYLWNLIDSVLRNKYLCSISFNIKEWLVFIMNYLADIL